MRVLSTVDAYLALADLGAQADEHAWRARYEAAYPDVFATYYREWGAPGRRGAATAALAGLAPLMRERERRALDMLERVSRDFAGRGLLPGKDMPVVLMVGVGSSNGWVTPFRREPTLFLALEFLGQPPGDEILINHETVHLAHQLAAPQWAQQADSSVAGALFFEGLATAMSRVLCPGHSDSQYCWFDDEHADWADECAKAAGPAAAKMIDELDVSRPEVVRHWFAGGPGSSVPTRWGYWCGDRLAAGLLDQHDPADVLRLDYPTARQLAAEHLRGY